MCQQNELNERCSSGFLSVVGLEYAVQSRLAKLFSPAKPDPIALLHVLRFASVE